MFSRNIRRHSLPDGVQAVSEESLLDIPEEHGGKEGGRKEEGGRAKSCGKVSERKSPRYDRRYAIYAYHILYTYVSMAGWLTVKENIKT